MRWTGNSIDWLKSRTREKKRGVTNAGRLALALQFALLSGRCNTS